MLCCNHAASTLLVGVVFWPSKPLAFVCSLRLRTVQAALCRDRPVCGEASNSQRMWCDSHRSANVPSTPSWPAVVVPQKTKTLLKPRLSLTVSKENCRLSVRLGFCRVIHGISVDTPVVSAPSRPSGQSCTSGTYTFGDAPAGQRGTHATRELVVPVSTVQTVTLANCQRAAAPFLAQWLQRCSTHCPHTPLVNPPAPTDHLAPVFSGLGRCYSGRSYLLNQAKAPGLPPASALTVSTAGAGRCKQVRTG